MENGELRIDNVAHARSDEATHNFQFSIFNSQFPTAYAPNIAYISAIAHVESVCIDVDEPYIRQTFRNRCEILTSQGVKKLSIPVEKKSTQTGTIKDVKIDYAGNWQRQHWRTLQTAYNNSPYFLYYQDEVRKFYEKRCDFLVDFNAEILEFLLKKLRITKYELIRHVERSRDIPLRGDSSTTLDMTPFCNSQFPVYPQVFNPEKFVPNLSSFDLLFNCGPESKSFLCKE